MKKVKVRMSDRTEGTALLPADQADGLIRTWNRMPIPIHDKGCEATQADKPVWECSCGAYQHKTDKPRPDCQRPTESKLHVRLSQVVDMVSGSTVEHYCKNLGVGDTLTCGEIDHTSFTRHQQLAILEVVITVREPREGEIV